MKPAPPMKWSS